MRALKSPLPRTFRSSQLALTSPEVTSDLSQLYNRKTGRVNSHPNRSKPKKKARKKNSRLLLSRLEGHPVARSQSDDRIATPHKLRHRDLLEERVVTLIVTLSLTTLLLGRKDVLVRVIGGGALAGEGHDGGEVLEDVSGVEKLGVDVGRGKVVLADDEDLGGDVTEERGGNGRKGEEEKIRWQGQLPPIGNKLQPV
jgi:hypothetical protein